MCLDVKFNLFFFQGSLLEEIEGIFLIVFVACFVLDVDSSKYHEFKKQK